MPSKAHAALVLLLVPLAAAAAALTIHADAGERMTALFPAGSLDQPSEAPPDIWDTFRRLAGQAERYSAALADAAADPPSNAPLRLRDITLAAGPDVPDPGALAAAPPDHAFSYLAKTCVACHERFRQSND